FEPVNLDRAWGDVHNLAVACEIIGALARDFHRREARRHLGDLAGEARQQRADGLGGRALGAALSDAAFGVVGIGLFAPAHAKAVDLAPLHDERNGLGRFSERDGQQTRGEWVERAGMAGAFRLEQAFHHAHRIGRAHAYGFVEHDPAVHVALHALVLRRGRRLGLEPWHLWPSVLWSRSRWTAGVRNSFSIRSASSKRSSIRNRISGANFKLMRRAISPRRKRLLRSSAASTASASRPPSGTT